ncbi:MAG: hypothetical protein ABJC13_02140 [Acidobacteriota bacterium]
MECGLSISVVDPDPDYLGIKIRGWNERFSGTTFIYAECSSLSGLAAQIAGFPKGIPDERVFVFGSKDPRVAGGYCRLRLRTIGGVGHAMLDIEIDDKSEHDDSPGLAAFSNPIAAASVDDFVGALRRVEFARKGDAMLPPGRTPCIQS